MPDGEAAEYPWGVPPYRWIAVGDAFIECDVIRWIEAVWERKRRKRKPKPRKIGEREVIAEVIEIDEDEGWVHLNVLVSQVTRERREFWKGPIQVPESAERIKRKRHNIVRNLETVYRLAWSDESAREVVLRDRVLARENAAESQPDRRAEEE